MSDPGQMSSGVSVLSGGVLNVYTEAADITLQPYHAGSYIRLGNAALTIPTDATQNFAVGTVVNGIASNATAGTFTAAGGVTLTSKGSSTSLSAQGSGFTLVKTGPDAWDLKFSIETLPSTLLRRFVYPGDLAEEHSKPSPPTPSRLTVRFLPFQLKESRSMPFPSSHPL